MGTVTLTGAVIIITAWITLIEFDHFPESKRTQIIQKIKGSPAYILLIALMPVGILVNVLGGLFGSLWMVIIGASLIILQSIIISFLFWRQKRWKSILLFVVTVVLGFFIYFPLFMH